MISRLLIAVLLLSVAVWLVANADARETLGIFLALITALGLLLMAIVIGLRPLRWSGPCAILLLLVPLATALVHMEGRGLLIPLTGVFVLVLLGAGLRGLLQHTPERIAADLASADSADRRRGMEHLAFLVEERLRPQLAACDSLLEVARTSDDPELRSEAESIRNSGSRGSRDSEDPMEALDDELAEALADEALSDTKADEGGVEPPAHPPSLTASIDVLRGGEPGACRREIERLVAMGPAAVEALEAAAEEGNPDLRIDALRALELIAQAEGREGA